MTIPQQRLREHLHTKAKRLSFKYLPLEVVKPEDLEPGQHFCENCNGYGYLFEFSTGLKHECDQCGFFGLSSVLLRGRAKIKT